MFIKYNKNLKNLSRRLRQDMTDAEKLLWLKIRRKQIKSHQFYRQKPIGNYIVDFYCPKARIGIEIDGGQHYETRNEKQDRMRTKYLNKFGFKIIRFTNLDVLKNIDNVVRKIWEEINSPPLQKGD